MACRSWMYVQNRRACSPKEPGCVPTGASARAACTRATCAEVSLSSFSTYITVVFSVFTVGEKLSSSFISWFFNDNTKRQKDCWRPELAVKTVSQRLWLINVRCQCHTWLHHLHSHEQERAFGDI